MVDKKQQQRSEVGQMSVQCVQDSIRWFGDTVTTNAVEHHALALAGEVGEFCNLVKKIQRGSLDPSQAIVQHDLAMELTDVFIYTLNIAGLLNVDLKHAYEVKRIENERRFMAERRMREARNGQVNAG